MSDTQTNEFLLRIIRCVRFADGMLSEDYNELDRIKEELMALQTSGQAPKLNIKPKATGGKKRSGKRGC